MSLNIKNEEAEELVRRLADATGESVTRAVTIAVRERLERVQKPSSVRSSQIRQISQDAGSRWIEPFRSRNHGELLYDKRGLPR